MPRLPVAASMRRARLMVAGVVGVVVVVIGAGLLAVELGGSRRVAPAGARPGRPAAAHPSAAPSAAPSVAPSAIARWTAVPPVTDHPAQSPIQVQYDQELASGLGSSPSVLAAEAAEVPAPALTAAWPALPVANDPAEWTQAFVGRLLGVDFAHESRAGLAAWLSAEEAPELLPGVPAGTADKVLYLSLFDTASVGANSTPVPSASQWQLDADEGAVSSVSGLLVEPDPQWSQIIASGWQPSDVRFAVEDVAGLLTMTQGRSKAVHHFSMVVYTGSAHWHGGFGTVLVSQWQES